MSEIAAKPLFTVKRVVIRHLQQFIVVIALLILMGILTVVSPSFLTLTNLLNITRSVSIIGIMAVGMTFVIITGGIDLSVGSIFAISGAVTAGFLGTTGTNAPYINSVNLPVVLAVFLGLLAGLILGFINGKIVTKLRVPPFITTLGMLSFARGLTYLYTQGYPVSPESSAFLFLGKGFILGLPVPTLIFIIVSILGAFILNMTAFGRSVYIIGENSNTAYLSGIDVKKIKYLSYSLLGVLSALSGILLTARVAAASPVAGSTYELDVIAAVVIGGTSLSGGRGSIFGTILGVLLMGVITNGLNLLGLQSYYQYIVRGTVVILALTLDYFLKKK